MTCAGFNAELVFPATAMCTNSKCHVLGLRLSEDSHLTHFSPATLCDLFTYERQALSIISLHGNPLSCFTRAHRFRPCSARRPSLLDSKWQRRAKRGSKQPAGRQLFLTSTPALQRCCVQKPSCLYLHGHRFHRDSFTRAGLQHTCRNVTVQRLHFRRPSKV